MTRTMKERMLAGELYLAEDPQLRAERARAQRLLARYNATAGDEDRERARLLRELLGAVGEEVVINPPLRCDYGAQISVGARVFINYECIMLDVAPITIGSDCQIGTRVQLLTATHPLDPRARRLGWEAGAPIVIGDGAWLGSGVIVCPGVSIGADTVLGAGAVVTRDLPAGVLAAGVPARAIRAIGEADRISIPAD